MCRLYNRGKSTEDLNKKYKEMKTGFRVQTKLQHIAHHLPTVWSRETQLLCSIEALTGIQLKEFCEIEVITCIKAHQRLSVNNK